MVEGAARIGCQPKKLLPRAAVVEDFFFVCVAACMHVLFQQQRHQDKFVGAAAVVSVGLVYFFKALGLFLGVINFLKENSLSFCPDRLMYIFLSSIWIFFHCCQLLDDEILPSPPPPLLSLIFPSHSPNQQQ